MNGLGEIRALSTDGIKRATARLLVACTLVALAAWVVSRYRPLANVANLPWFQVKQVSIEADWPLTEAVVRQWLPPLEGKSLWLIRARHLISLLETKPWVESVTVRKDFPSRLGLKIGTRKAVAILIERGESIFTDEKGHRIDRVTPELAAHHALPVITFRSAEAPTTWALSDAIALARKTEQQLPKGHRLSEVALNAFPYFRLYLEPRSIEAEFDYRSWGEQLPRLVTVLQTSLLPEGALRLSLLYRKKTIVSQSFSH